MRHFLYAGIAWTALASAALAGTAVVPEPGAPAPGPRVFPPSDGPGDIDPSDRFDAYRQLFGPYMNAEFKAHMLAELKKQQARFPNQTAGVKPVAAPAWSSIGPASDTYTINGVTLTAVDSGRLRSIVPNPSNPNQLYLLTAGGGLWRTNNLLAPTATWTPLTDGWIDTGGAAAIGRSFDTIYVGTGDPFETTPALGGYLLKSTDGGLNFNYSYVGSATQVRDVAVDTSGATDIVMAATDTGLWVSTDGGNNFSSPTASGPLAGLEAWSIKRTSAGWLATFVQPGLGIAAHAQATLAISTDHGASWTPITDTSFAGSGRVTVAVGKPGDAIVYAVSSDDTGYDQKDLFRSTDGGKTWAALGLGTGKVPSNPNCYQTNTDFLNGQAYYNQSLLVDSNDKTRGTIYLGGNLSLGKSTDGGASWTLVGNWLPGSCDDHSNDSIAYVHADHHTNAVIRGGKNPILAFGTDGGLFLTKDGGATFDATRNKGIASMLTQTVASTKTTALVSGLQDNGVRSQNGTSKVWNQIFGGDGEGVAGSQVNDATMLIAGYYLNIYGFAGGVPKVTDPNHIYDYAYVAQNGLNLTSDYFPFFTPLTAAAAKTDPTGLVFYTFTGSTVYQTTNGGQNWAPILHLADSSGTPQYVFRLYWNELSVSPKNPGKLAVGGTGGHIVTTTDNFFSTFNYVSLNSLGLGFASYVSSTTWTPNEVLYVSSQSPTFGATRVLKSTDAGSTWTAAGNGLPDVPVNHVVADPLDKTGNTVYAATWLGVYQTVDGGSNWSLLGGGLPSVQVSSLNVSPDGKTLRAATYGRGVWTLKIH